MNAPQSMPEEFLHYIWENRLYDAEGMKSTENEKLVIIDPGRRNNDAGPDFFNAKIKLGETTWAGNVEIHQNASDWNKHNHHYDKAYDNVILHVVETADKTIKRTNGEVIPTLLLKYPNHLANNYKHLIDSKTWIPCADRFHRIDPIILQLGFNRLMIERLESKTEEIVSRLKHNNNDWNETFYQMLARMFGFKTNAVPFELLAKSLPVHILSKHGNNLFQLEALLYGNAGLLNKQLLGDDYFLQLREEYSFLYKKYKLKPIEAHLWKFMRLRPVNFPSIRIAQFAALVYGKESLFSKILERKNIQSLRELFKVQASEYWNSHYNFNKGTSRKIKKELGEASINILIINTVIPFLFVFGEHQNQQHLKNRALEFLEQIPAEHNSVIKKWGNMGVKAHSAFESQALLQLKNSYCEQKKCLNCQIGVKLMSTTD